MGWTYSPSWPTAEAVRNALHQSLTASGYTVHGDALTPGDGREQHYYAAISKDGVPRTVFVALIERGDRYGWGYKDMDESMGPYVYDAPLRLLEDLGPPPNEWAAKWREGVRANHA
jgi:hypothetical protein